MGGLKATMARTAVIAGTATAVSGGVRSGQQATAQQQVAPAGDDASAKLAKLGELKCAGELDDADFAAAKAQL